MTTPFTQPSTESGLFSRWWRRIYDARLEKAMREVRRHQQFLRTRL